MNPQEKAEAEAAIRTAMLNSAITDLLDAIFGERKPVSDESRNPLGDNDFHRWSVADIHDGLKAAVITGFYIADDGTRSRYKSQKTPFGRELGSELELRYGLAALTDAYEILANGDRADVRTLIDAYNVMNPQDNLCIHWSESSKTLSIHSREEHP